jgi:hypothetical protein
LGFFMAKHPQTEAEIRAYCLKHFNDFIVVGKKVARLIGFARDDGGSSYLILHAPGRIYWYPATSPYKGIAKDERGRIEAEMAEANVLPAAEFSEMYGSRWRP